jgi:hypothetical protein
MILTNIFRPCDPNQHNSEESSLLENSVPWPKLQRSRRASLVCNAASQPALPLNERVRSEKSLCDYCRSSLHETFAPLVATEAASTKPRTHLVNTRLPSLQRKAVANYTPWSIQHGVANFKALLHYRVRSDLITVASNASPYPSMGSLRSHEVTNLLSGAYTQTSQHWETHCH